MVDGASSRLITTMQIPYVSVVGMKKACYDGSMMLKQKPKLAQLGYGIYTVDEAARYARVSNSMVNRWVFGNKQGNAVIEADYLNDPAKLISFLDFIQLVAIREIRVSRKVPLEKFRQAIKVAKQDFGFEHPFARKHCVYLWGEDFVITPPDRADQPFIEASGKHRGQRLFKFVEAYLDDLSYDENGLANRYRIFQSGRVAIEMNPRIRFGEPILPSNYSVDAIWDAIQSEGSMEQAAKSYGISLEEVRASYLFHVKYLDSTKAA